MNQQDMKIVVELETLPLPLQRSIYARLKEKFEWESASGEDILKIELDNISSFNPRIRRLLCSFRIQTFEDLTDYSRHELRKIRGMGKLSIQYVEDFLLGYKLALKKY